MSAPTTSTSRTWVCRTWANQAGGSWLVMELSRRWRTTVNAGDRGMAADGTDPTMRPAPWSATRPTSAFASRV